MPKNDDPRQMVHNLLLHFEQLTAENAAYLSILSNIEIPKFQEKWKAMFQDLLTNSTANREIHDKFAPLHERITQAIDHHAALAVLLAVLPPKGKLQ